MTLDVSHSLAEALEVAPPDPPGSGLCRRTRSGQTSQQVLDQLAGDLGANGLLTSEIPSLPVQTSHPVAAASEALRERIRELMDHGIESG